MVTGKDKGQQKDIQNPKQDTTGTETRTEAGRDENEQDAARTWQTNKSLNKKGTSRSKNPKKRKGRGKGSHKMR